MYRPMQRHKNLIEEQDQQLDEITDIAKRLNYHAQDINVEINKQTKLTVKINSEMDKTQEKMNFAMKKLSALLKTSDSGTLYTIMMLSLILIVLVFLVVLT